ncbi:MULTISPECIES: hypothetical protein [Cyanophyceae]|nr:MULTISPECIES: hypothetical protein [Cyanophyceae]
MTIVKFSLFYKTEPKQDKPMEMSRLPYPKPSKPPTVVQRMELG